MNRLAGVLVYGAIGGLLGGILGFALLITITAISGFRNQQLLSILPVVVGIVTAIMLSAGYLATTRSRA